MIKSFNCRFYYWLLVLLIFYVKGLEGFFIKDSSGLCFKAGPSIHNDNRGNFHYVLLDQDCLHDAAQFRFMNNGVLYNIGRDGCFVLFYSFSERANIFVVLHARPDNVDTCKAEDAVSQNSRGLLLFKPRREECVAPRQPFPYGALFRTNKSYVGDHLLPSSMCDKKTQQFTFGSVTCEGTVTTDVNCNPDQVMVIQNAVYGRYNNMTTCLHNGNANCTVSVTRMVKSLCEGRQNCTIMVNNELSKEDPCPGLQNYLYLEYNCADCVVPVKQFFVNDVRLSTSALPNEGFLEINISDTRSKVCSKSLNSGANEVVCRQLGYRGTKQNNPSVPNVYRNSRNFSGKINCVGNETVLSHCCVNAAREGTCSELAYVNCLICSEPLLENKKKFPDTAFTASQSLDNHDAPKARLSSNSSWCAPPDGSHYLQVDLGRVYVINSVTTFGDSSSANWVTSYKLTYTSDGIKWTERIVAGMKGNTYAYSNAATSDLNNIRARILKFIPLSSNGQGCMRIEICGHKLFPDQPRNLTITHKTSSSVTFSWLPPDNDPTDKPVLLFRIKIEQGRDIVYNVSATNETDEKELRDLSPFTEYKLSVAARNVYGFGKESTVSFTTTEEAPSGPPRNVTVMARNSSSLFVSWKEPDEDKKNGIITNYTVCISHFKVGPCFKSYTTSRKSITVANLNSSTKYSVRVLARTSVGSGNFSLDLERFTNGNPPNKPVNKTTQTLLFTLPSPKGNFSYFQVIAMKLLDDNTPSQSPDSFQGSDLVNYADAKTYPEPKPYIAAVLATTNDLDFQLGDGKNFSIPSARRRRSTTNNYYNGPLEPDTSYSVFQRVYINQDDYYSTDWSPPARTSPSPTTIPSSSTFQSTSGVSDDNKMTYIIIGVVAIVVILVAVIAMVVFRRRTKKAEPKIPGEMLEMSAKSSDPLYQTIEVEESVDNEVVSEPVDMAHDEIEDGNKNDEQIYCNDQEIIAEITQEAVPIPQFDFYVDNMKHNSNYGFKKQFEELPTGQHFNWDVAKRSFNKPKNRYGNIVTYDWSRVILTGDQKTDYINASHIDGVTENYYIATQGPKKGTINDFWRMVFEKKCPTIVMLTTLVELGKVKCEKYWPDDSAEYGEIKVTTVKTRAFADFVTRTFKVEKDEEKLEVKQFHFTTWPDHGVPHYPTQLLSFRKHFKSYQDGKNGPVVVHCSAGVGRTGVFIVIDRIIDEIETKAADTVDIFGLVNGLRARRMNMVQTPEQYMFIHDAILDHIKCGTNEVDAVNLKIEINKLSKTNSKGETGFEEKFKRLSDVSPQLTREECDAALIPENKIKNRKADIYPSELSRVYLRHLEDVENSDYINACYVDGYLGQNYFIATQTPLNETINDFWRMISEHNSSTIVMLNQLKENDEEYPMFWPTERAKPRSYGSVTLQLDSTKKTDDIILRKFIISPSPDLKEGHPIKLIQYIGWPDHGAPKMSDDVVRLHSEVEKSQRAAGKGPVTVMCSDGAGRTGTYIAVSNIVDRIKIVQAVDVFQCIKLIRSKRPQFVENVDQFKMCYDVVDALLKSFSEYANFELKEN